MPRIAPRALYISKFSWGEDPQTTRSFLLGILDSTPFPSYIYIEVQLYMSLIS